MASDSSERFQFSLGCLLKAVAIFGVVIGMFVGAGRLYHRWLYPYGWSHCCDKGLWALLSNYADAHGGAFPAGETTPEASLSLLYPKYADANVLRGKTVPLSNAEAALKSRGRLDQSTCGWHYVEGLTIRDDPGIALFWDKIGLGHNGQRISDGGHSVVFIGGDCQHIPGDRWQTFLHEQEKLLARRTRVPAPLRAGPSQAATQPDPAPRD